MRLWSLHPKYLDARGLVALWREALLAQAVLRGRTAGYTHHPQLVRFRERAPSTGFMAEYLRAIHRESLERGYAFAASRIGRTRAGGAMTVTRGQLAFEWRHLMKKLATRDPERRALLAKVRSPEPHPLFRVVDGGVATWERGAGGMTATRRRSGPATTSMSSRSSTSRARGRGRTRRGTG